MTIDMGIFFIVLEIGDNPSLKSIPIIVGSMSIISTSNNNTRK